MIVIGLTGGIASGKSFVAGLLAERGAVVLDADRYAGEARDEPEVRAALVDRWGEGILTEDGSLDTAQIAGRVFGQGDEATAERRFLEALIHPRVRERLRVKIDQARCDGAPAAVLDVPLLHESGWAEECDTIWFVDVSDEVRQARAAQRGWTAEELARREAAQFPLSEKRGRADCVIPGESPAESRQAVALAWERWGPGSGAGRHDC